jgi:hypothetical protein
VIPETTSPVLTVSVSPLVTVRPDTAVPSSMTSPPEVSRLSACAPPASGVTMRVTSPLAPALWFDPPRPPLMAMLSFSDA